MTMRTTSRAVTFTRPFILSGMDGVQPAGTYTVATEEQLLQDVSFPAYRRISTVIVLPSQSARAVWTQVVDINPVELKAILKSMAGLSPAAEATLDDLFAERGSHGPP